MLYSQMQSNPLHMHARARFSGIRIVPAKAPSLYQECVKVFVAELARSEQQDQQVAEMNFLPAKLLANIFEEMCEYPALSGVLRKLLCDPVLFMRVFTNQSLYVVGKCLRHASSSSGKPIVPELTKNYCDMVRDEPLDSSSSAFMSRIQGALKLGSFVYEAGWAASSVKVLKVVQSMISSVEDKQLRAKLELDCIQRLLRAEASSVISKAGKTCDILLSLTTTVEDTNVLIKSYLQVAYYQYRARQYEQCHEWTLKTMNLITSSTPIDDIIEVLQLEALFCFNKQRYDLGNMLISQAIQRARSHYGTYHRGYAAVLQNYGLCLIKMNATSAAIPALMEALDVTVRHLGSQTPHVPMIESYIAYGLFRRSQSTGRFDMALDHIDRAIAATGQMMLSGAKQTLDYLNAVRDLIRKGCDSARTATKECKPAKADSYDQFTFSEIREKYFELNESFEKEITA
ncbi:uncharacterized protein LOC129771067 [Toxorhynchites rutilus septentrionalis]|uniref:uncharacterized protein LOC129771067 n=1 Tax=Toxorhynchites rutilus septentrionalis TaxID=329112 RepID=UPI0024794C05|nr:uncharacterized protein LOC129771067 [Toxorhynchites rutilus septentrionalis]